MKRLQLFFLAVVMAALPPWSARADDPATPGDGFAATRYETLWTKSPFSVASPDSVQESPDYSLVGIAEVAGISYVSLVDKQNQEHFLVASDKETRGLTLTSINRGKDGGDTTAVLQRNGQSLTLKLEQAPAAAAAPGNPPPNMPAMNPGFLPTGVTPSIPRPGADGGSVGGQQRPPVRFRHFPIHVPPMPQTGATPAPVPTPPPPPQ